MYHGKRGGSGPGGAIETPIYPFEQCGSVQMRNFSALDEIHGRVATWFCHEMFICVFRTKSLAIVLNPTLRL